MAFSKRKNFPLIKYTSRDFESIKNDLREYSSRYYPNIAKDRNEASFDELMMDTVAYVGDILSFYLDYAVNESFLETAVEYNNVIRLGKQMGYKFKGNPSATGVETFYVIVPARSLGLGPDLSYIPILKKGSQLSSINGNSYILNEDVDFSKSTNEIVVARVDERTGTPTSYAIKAYGKIISGKIVEELVVIGNFQKFLKIELVGKNITEILSVIDSEGNEYFEVDYLSQDIIYRPIPNRDTSKDRVPFILRPFVVPRRFVFDMEKNKSFLQFGFGSDSDVTSEPLIDPSRVVLNVFGKNYESNSTFDPANILGTDKMGVAPANTTLKITYRTNVTDSVNANVNSITSLNIPLVEFDNKLLLNQETMRTIIDSIECVNEEPIVGDVGMPSIQELKLRVYDSYGAQNRAVTEKDYKALIYNMPPKYGAIKRVSIAPDANSFKRNLNLYVISENSDGSLVACPPILKENLKTWINSSKMMNDSIDILDAKIINLGIDFTVIGELDESPYDVQSKCIDSLSLLFNNKGEIGEAFSVASIYSTLSKVPGVMDVVKVKVYQKSGVNYSGVSVDINSLMTGDGKHISCPENCIFEIKNLNADIKGAVK